MGERTFLSRRPLPGLATNEYQICVAMMEPIPGVVNIFEPTALAGPSDEQVSNACSNDGAYTWGSEHF